MNGKTTILTILFVLGSLSLVDYRSRADAPTAGFEVEFSACLETIGVGLVPTDLARALVPPEFILVGEGTPVTPIVVRTSRCGGISFDGLKPKPGAIVQI